MQKTLKELRQEKQISQVDMSKKLSMSFNNYVNYERGYYKTMSAGIEKKISEILETEYTYSRG